MTMILNWHVLYTHLCSTHQEALIACHFKKALELANLKFCLSGLQLSYIQLHSDTTNCTKRCNLCNGMKSLEICFDATTCDLLRENFRNFVASSRLVTENNVMVHNTLWKYELKFTLDFLSSCLIPVKFRLPWLTMKGRVAFSPLVNWSKISELAYHQKTFRSQTIPLRYMRESSSEPLLEWF